MTTRMFLYDTRPEAPQPEREVALAAGIDAERMREVLDLMTEMEDEQGRVHMVFELDVIPWITPAALFEKARQAGQLRKLRGRYAVATDMKLLEKAMPLADALMEMETQVFPLAELEAAKDWARAA